MFIRDGKLLRLLLLSSSLLSAMFLQGCGEKTILQCDTDETKLALLNRLETYDKFHALLSSNVSVIHAFSLDDDTEKRDDTQIQCRAQIAYHHGLKITKMRDIGVVTYDISRDPKNTGRFRVDITQWASPY
ncbi:hypothetical protein [Providencia stuartii]|uniref:hypothetical protein n=1 Tax=Providencia stuartii TaxID=588 RepID=UPI0011223F2C